MALRTGQGRVLPLFNGTGAWTRSKSLVIGHCADWLTAARLRKHLNPRFGQRDGSRC
jgi:hypothetical protein